jgi:hypothetical protein
LCQGNNSSLKPSTPDSTFISSLYVGFFEHNYYALPSLVYNSPTNLIEGPTAPISSDDDQHQIVPFPINADQSFHGESQDDPRTDIGL